MFEGMFWIIFVVFIVMWVEVNFLKDFGKDFLYLSWLGIFIFLRILLKKILWSIDIYVFIMFEIVVWFVLNFIVKFMLW